MSEFGQIQSSGAVVAEASQSDSLPFDLRTLLVGLRRRLPLTAAIALCSVGLGAIGGRAIGARVYEASTVLLYKASQGASAESDGRTAPSLRTLVDLVKLAPNLEAVRRTLSLPATIDQIGSAIEITVPENSQLMLIKVQWDDAERAAAIANAVRDAFFEHQRIVRSQEAQAQVEDLETRLARVKEQLAATDTTLKNFTIKHRVVDLDKEADWYLQQLIDAEFALEQAIGDQRASQIQKDNMSKIVTDLKNRAASEEQQVGAEGTPADANDGRTALLRSKQFELQRAKILLDKGLISEMDYRRTEAAYQAERYSVYNNSPSAGLLKEMTLKELNVRLDNIAENQKVQQLQEAVTRMKARLNSLPLVQREYIGLTRDVQARAQERERLEQVLGGVRRIKESNAADFGTVSVAVAPRLPIRSNRTIVFAVISAFGAIGGLAFAIALEVGNRKIRSRMQAELGLKVPALGEVAAGALGTDADRDAFIRLAQRVRALLPDRGARLLVASATHGEGTSSVASRLATRLAQRGDRVLLIDARLHRGAGPAGDPGALGPGWRGRLTRLRARLGLLPALALEHDSLTARALSANGHNAGLAAFLSGRAATLADVIQPTGHPSVDLIAAGSDAADVHVGSPRMAQLLDAASAQYDAVIIETAPTLSSADANLIAESVHGVLLVVQAERATADLIGRAVTLLRAAQTPLIGSFVTNVHTDFLEQKAS